MDIALWGTGTLTKVIIPLLPSWISWNTTFYMAKHKLQTKNIKKCRRIRKSFLLSLDNPIIPAAGNQYLFWNVAHEHLEVVVHVTAPKARLCLGAEKAQGWCTKEHIFQSAQYPNCKRPKLNISSGHQEM